MKSSHYAFLIAMVQWSNVAEKWAVSLGGALWFATAIIVWLAERHK